MMRTRLYTSNRVLVAFVLIYVLGSSAVAQTAAPAPPGNRRSSPGDLTALPVQITPGDLLEISVFDTPELTQQVRVGADGEAELALLGNVSLAGLTTQQASEKIARELRQRQLLLRPQVNVLVKESASQGVSVVGEVEHPGMYPLLGPRSLLDVLSMAGGLTKVADTKVSIKRRDGLQRDVTVRLNNNDAHISLANDVQIHPGDLVMVPRAGIVYVLGAVNRPGGFVIQENGEITLLQALAQAGGATSSASVNHALLLRKNGQGYVPNKLPVGKIELGQDRDVELHPDDVVFIPTNRLKNVLHATQDVATSIGSASIYAVVH
jgi:polysaccharide export outer membrane protein